MTVVAFPGRGAVVPFPKRRRMSKGVTFVYDGNFFTDSEDPLAGEKLWTRIQSAEQQSGIE